MSFSTAFSATDLLIWAPLLGWIAYLLINDTNAPPATPHEAAAWDDVLLVGTAVWI